MLKAHLSTLEHVYGGEKYILCVYLEGECGIVPSYTMKFIRLGIEFRCKKYST